MEFDLNEVIHSLRKTPKVLRLVLQDLPEHLIYGNEGPDTWSPFDIVGHLIHGEKTDWMVRCRLILKPDGPHRFEPFDRFAQFEDSQGKRLDDLLDEFEQLRAQNLEDLKALSPSGDQLALSGVHPEFGIVTLKELLFTWVTHDYSHLTQVSRVLAKQYRNDVGPWKAYMRVLK